MNKFSFPKGSLKFKKLSENKVNEIEKTEKWKMNLKDYILRKKYVDLIEKTYPMINDGEMRIDMPEEVCSGFKTSQSKLNKMREAMKNTKSFPSKVGYEVKFVHPKWSKVIGEIIMKSEGSSIKETLNKILVEFQKKKKAHRQFRFKAKKVKIESLKTDITYNVSGGVIYMPEVREGVYVKFLKEQEKRIVFSNKTPKELSQNYVGVEIEFLSNISPDELGLKLYQAGLGRFVTLKEDGSIKCSHGNYPSNCNEHKVKEYAHELCVIAKEGEYVDILKKACKVLEEVKATVNKSCGMHTHIDMRNRNPDMAYQNLISSQHILLKMNPASRTEKFAKKNNQRNFQEATVRGGNTGGNYDEERYYGINAKSFPKHQTIEIRFHAGTIDFTKITNWVAILLKIVNHSEAIVKSFISINTFCKQYDIEDSLKAYIDERIKKFAVKGETEMIPEAETGAA